MRITNKNNLNINVFSTRIEMGTAAGRDIESKIVELQKKQDEIRIIFAAAPSQNEMLDYLATSKIIEWGKIVTFHMDEYIGLGKDSSQLFSTYLKERLFDRVKPKKVNLINIQGDIKVEIERYSLLIAEAPVDIVCLGIGENGHIAFNDPPVADFADSNVMKKVQLQESCRLQQVNEGCFNTLKEVPESALTLTIPVILNASYLFCVVPGISKRCAVKNTITGPIESSCPGSILQTHNNCSFYFDSDSFGELIF
jgi:glucosamine-6-phosphate deaminase